MLIDLLGFDQKMDVFCRCHLVGCLKRSCSFRVDLFQVATEHDVDQEELLESVGNFHRIVGAPVLKKTTPALLKEQRKCAESNAAHVKRAAVQRVCERWRIGTAGGWWRSGACGPCFVW